MTDKREQPITVQAVNKGGKRGPKSPLSQEHLDALDQGRHEGRIVKEYLTALKELTPKRGRKRTAASVGRYLREVELALNNETYESEVDRLGLLQQRRDLRQELEFLKRQESRVIPEAEFIKVVKSYSERRGISWDTWKEIGVPVPVLKAGWGMNSRTKPRKVDQPQVSKMLRARDAATDLAGQGKAGS